VPLVLYAAAVRDPVAVALLDRQANEVVRYIAAATVRLGLGDGEFDMVLSGSLVAEERSPTVIRVRERRATAMPRARAVVCTTPQSGTCHRFREPARQLKGVAPPRWS